MGLVKKLLFWVLATIALYFCSVFTLYMMTLLFHAVFENIWSSAIPVVFLSEMVLLVAHIRSKRKQQAG